MKRATRVPVRRRARYAPSRAYARGDAARQRLIAAGLELFGRHGFDGASTRDIAAAAGLNAPSLQYYFNNKRGLYLACAQYVVGEFWAAMRDVIVAAERLLSARASHEALVDAFCAMWAEFGDFLGAADEGLFLLIARDQSGREPYALFEGSDRRVKRLSRATHGILGRLLRVSPRRPECLLRATSLSGQLWIFYFLRRSVLRKLRRRSLGAETLADIKRINGEHTRASLKAMIRESSRKA